MSLADALSGLGNEPKSKIIEPPHPVFIGKMACFDQTLTKTGAGILVFTASHKIVPMLTQMFLNDSDTGENVHEQSLERGVSLEERFRMFLSQQKPDVVIHESPPPLNRMSRPESSLLAALSLRIAARSLGIPYYMVHSQKAKVRTCGDRTAKKAEVKAVIEKWIPEIKTLKPWNQDVSDAIAVGITKAEEKF